MKSFFQKSGAVGLAFLLLFSTLSFSMDMHFCGKTLVDFEIYQKAEGCGMAMDDSLMTDMGCCSDKQIVVAGQDDLDTPNWETLSGELHVLVAWIAEGYPALELPEIRDAFIPFKEYSPPKLIRDIPVLDQTFLI